MAKAPTLIKCRACGIEKDKSMFASKSDCCLVCTNSGNAPKLIIPEAPVIDTPPPAFSMFPVAEGNYADPSVQEIAARTLARRNLLRFIMRFKPKYMPGWVHEDICRRLMRFMQRVEDKEEPRLLLMMPPRAGKSEIGSRHFVPFVLGHHPDWEIIAASHTSSLSLGFSRYIRDLMRDPSYQALFPSTILDPNSQSVENWNLTAGGGYLAAGVGTGITGRGAHILLLDDLVKDIEAADSQTQRDNTWEWYTSTAYTRLAPGGGVLGIMTHWHDDDWAGRIQQVMASGDGDKFEIIKYPAINDQGNEYILEDDQIVQIPLGSDVPENARKTRSIGTAIHPERYSTDAMLRIKRNLYAAGQQRIWSSLYQQNPSPEDGAYFTKPMFKEYEHELIRRDVTIYQAWDFAITEGTQNDWTVCATILQDSQDNLYFLDVYRFRCDDGIEIVKRIVDHARAWEVDLIGFEDGQIWKALSSTFEKECNEQRYYPSYELLKPLTDKLVRAQPLRGRMQAGKVWFPSKAPWYQEFRTELLRFPAGKHDDQVDGAAWVVRLTLSKAAPRVSAPPPVKSWRDKLGQFTEGVGETSHMAG